MTHLIQACLEKHPDWIVIKTDAKNATSTVDRSVFLSELSSINFSGISSFCGTMLHHFSKTYCQCRA